MFTCVSPTLFHTSVEALVRLSCRPAHMHDRAAQGQNVCPRNRSCGEPRHLPLRAQAGARSALLSQPSATHFTTPCHQDNRARSSFSSFSESSHSTKPSTHRNQDPSTRDLQEAVRAVVFWAEQAEKVSGLNDGAQRRGAVIHGAPHSPHRLRT